VPRILTALATLLLAAAATAAQGRTLMRVRVETSDPRGLSAALLSDGFDVLEGAWGERSLDVVVSAEELLGLERLGLAPRLVERGRPFAAIQRERRAQAPPEAPVPLGYSDLGELYQRMNAAAAAHPAICTVVDLTARYAGVPGVTPTFEGRPLFALKVSDNVALEEDEPTALFVACHHAREIVTPEIALYALEQLTTLYGTDPAVTAAVDGHEIWIAPMWNPDGYVEVFQGDNFWRKNRRVFAQGTGVDLNRNYPFGWSAQCGGSTSPSSETYRGPSAASEAETQTMLTFSADRRFAKVVDYHSYASEVRVGNGCWYYPLQAFLQSAAIALSQASGYGGSWAESCCLGGDIHLHYATTGTLAFLIETHTSFQPPHASALAEAAKMWPGILWTLARPISVSGHVTDACSGAPLAASLTISHPVPAKSSGYTHGETNGSGGAFGRYQAFLPEDPLPHTLTFSAPGYVTQPLPALVSSAGTALLLDVALVPLNPAGVSYCTAKLNSCGGLPAIAGSGTPSASAASGFVVQGTQAREAKSGLLIYTDAGRRVPALPFASGGYLCIAAPVRRTLAAASSGGTPGACDASFALDMNAFAAGALGGNPQAFLAVPGTRVNLQWWGRDTQAHGEYLSDALEYGICP
jgi:hypothetical protein